MAREFALKGGLLDELDDDHLENGDAGGEADASVARASGAFAAARDDDSGSDDAERAPGGARVCAGDGAGRVLGRGGEGRVRDARKGAARISRAPGADGRGRSSDVLG